MIKAYLIALAVFFLGSFYLILPSPGYPNLSGGARSDEPGDTWQHPDQKAFFTNESRNFVLGDIQKQFYIKAFGVNIPNFRLNYRPEEAQTLVRDQLNSYYLEEIVYPLRESIFVNGWEPKNAFKDKDTKEMKKSDIALHGVYYDAKITLKPTFSSLWSRLLVWSLVFPSLGLIYLSFKYEA